MASDKRQVEWGSTITLEMDLFLEDGELASSTKEEGPLEIEVGRGEVVPGLEEKLVGLYEGDSFSVQLEPGEGYGEYDEDSFELVESDMFGDEVEVGEDYFFEDEDGGVMVVTVAEIREDGIVIDYNHPLAGEALTFKGKIVKVS